MSGAVLSAKETGTIRADTIPNLIYCLPFSWIL